MSAYGEVRSLVRDGDVLLFQSRGPIAWLIRFSGRSSYSHAGMALWVDERLMVAESREIRGCRLITLSDALTTGSVDLFVPLASVALDRSAVRAQALDRLGQTYGWISFGWIALSKLPLLGIANALGLFQKIPIIGRWIPKWGRCYSEDDLEDPGRRLICSTYVAVCWRAGGVDLVPRLADRSTEPGDIARSAFLLRVGLLR